MTHSTYSGLESLYKKYRDKGLRILAFPSNDFGAQEPGSNADIKAFCAKKRVTFDLFAKVSVKGEKLCPLYEFLTTFPDELIAGDVPWNFQKYLISRDGKPIAKFHPRDKPDSEAMVNAIEKALATKPTVEEE